MVDTNIVLDLLLQREPFAKLAYSIFEQAEKGNLSVYVTATTFTNIFYIIRRAQDREIAMAAMERMLSGFYICAVDEQVLRDALSLGLQDFEDGIQLACAIRNRMDGIVTRNKKDFTTESLPIYTPNELLAMLV